MKPLLLLIAILFVGVCYGQTGRIGQGFFADSTFTPIGIGKIERAFNLVDYKSSSAQMIFYIDTNKKLFICDTALFVHFLDSMIRSNSNLEYKNKALIIESAYRGDCQI
jgi:hypothetical protein